MKALLVTHGTRGDVQPFLALAVALRAAGHQAILAAPASFATAAAEYGVEFMPLDEGPNRLLDDPVVREAMSNGYRGIRGKITAVRTAGRIKPLLADVLRDLTRLAHAEADVVVHSPTLPAQHLAERLGVPSVLATLQPGWVPTSALPCPMVPLPRLPKAFNRATYLTVSATLRAQAGPVNRWRTTELGLPHRRGGHHLLHEVTGARRLVLQAFSPLLAETAPDWPDTVHTTGFWHLPAPAGWTPPERLSAFLAQGQAPVYLGFGSMAGQHAAETARAVTAAVRRAGVRAVLATGWGGLAGVRDEDDLLVLDQAPHDWLFPRMRALVHHGGSGTTAAALLSGRPQVVCPFVADQPYWARRAHAVGIAPPPLPQRRLTADRLAEAIRHAVTDPGMATRAQALAGQARAETGADTAVELLVAHLHRVG